MTRHLHVADAGTWARARLSGEDYPIPGGGPFVHLCSPEQLPGVLERFYTPRPAAPLVLLTVDPAGLDIRMEPADGSDAPGLFAHLYGPLPVASVVDERPL